MEVDGDKEILLTQRAQELLLLFGVNGKPILQYTTGVHSLCLQQKVINGGNLADGLRIAAGDIRVIIGESYFVKPVISQDIAEDSRQEKGQHAHGQDKAISSEFHLGLLLIKKKLQLFLFGNGRWQQLVVQSDDGLCELPCRLVSLVVGMV